MQSRATVRRALGPVIVLAVVTALGGCGTGVPSPTPAAVEGSAAPGTAAPPATADLTPVPQATPAESPGAIELTEPPDPTDGAAPGTTDTAWGRILDAVPEDFPVFPDASLVEALDDPLSGAWMVVAGVDEAATWYGETLMGLGYTVDGLSAPLEDGSRVMDARTDLPECRLQLTFRPGGESTIITVLYGAGCAAAGG